MRSLVLLLLLLALFANTVSGVCRCNSDGSTTKTITVPENTLQSQSIECDEMDIELTCVWTLDAASGLIVAVGFSDIDLGTDLSTSATATVNGAADIEVTSTLNKDLTSTFDSTSTITLMINANVTVAPKLTFNYLAVEANPSDQSVDDVITVTGEGICISSPLFPANYPADIGSSWNVSAAGGALIDSQMIFMSTENECPGSDPLLVTIDEETPLTFCGTAGENFTSEGNSNIVLKFTSDDSTQGPGFLMCFTLSDPCNNGDPCNGGNCIAWEDNSDFNCTDCPPGFEGERCDEEIPNPCDDGAPCNGGNCTALEHNAGFECTDCPIGSGGEHCDEDDGGSPCDPGYQLIECDCDKKKGKGKGGKGNKWCRECCKQKRCKGKKDKKDDKKGKKGNDKKGKKCDKKDKKDKNIICKKCIKNP